MINRLGCRMAALAVALVAPALVMSPAAHAQGKWRAGTPIPQGANEVIGAEIDGQVLVYGGQDPGNNAMGIFWKLDPAKNEWSSLPSNPVPVHHGASATVGRKFYVLGGFRLPGTGNGGWSPENKAWGFAPHTQKRSALPNLPTARGRRARGPVGKKLYLIGAAHKVYDPKTNTWARAPRMITPRHGFAAADIGKAIYAVSGVNNAGGAGTLSVVPVNEIFEE